MRYANITKKDKKQFANAHKLDKLLLSFFYLILYFTFLSSMLKTPVSTLSFELIIF